MVYIIWTVTDIQGVRSLTGKYLKSKVVSSKLNYPLLINIFMS